MDRLIFQLGLCVHSKSEERERTLVKGLDERCARSLFRLCFSVLTEHLAALINLFLLTAALKSSRLNSWRMITLLMLKSINKSLWPVRLLSAVS